jgi:uncharacterized OB-fold protein
MKRCPTCGHSTSEQADQCPNCFEYFASNEPVTFSSSGRAVESPASKVIAPSPSGHRGVQKYEYLVVPFAGTVQTGMFSTEGAHTVSAQLQSILDEYAQQSWEYCSLAKVNIEVQPGCLGQLLGQSASYVTSDQLVFRRQVSKS